jgi:phage shock protein PspC (stress-responsive transcriptional regulator)
MPMVVMQRNEVSRMRVLGFLTILLSMVVVGGIASIYSSQPDPIRFLLVLLIAAACIAAILSLLQLFSHPKRSQVLLFHRDDDMVLATNAIHEGFKLRFLRDILGENVFSFSDEERARWKGLEADGFYATLYVRSVRKLIMVRLCTMIFDDVFVADPKGRWEHYDCSRTSEPSFTKPDMPALKSWKMRDLADNS